MVRFVPLAATGLRSQRLRAAVTVSSVVLCFLLFCALCALRRAVSFGEFVAEENRIRVSNRISVIESLPARYEEEIGRIPNVAAVAPATWFGGIYQDPRNFFMSLAVEPDEFLRVYPDIGIDPGAVDRWRETRDGAIAGSALFERFGWRPGDRVTLSAQIHPRRDGTRSWQFTLAGAYSVEDDAYSDSRFLLRQDYLKEGRTEDPGVSWFTVVLADAQGAAATASAIDEYFSNTAAPTVSQPEGAAIAAFARQFADFGAVFAAILSVMLGITVLVVGSTVSESVEERRREFAVLRALGFSPARLIALAAGEAGILVGSGAVVGLALGSAAISALGRDLAEMLPGLAFRTSDALFGAAVALGLAGLAAMPAVVRLRAGGPGGLAGE